MLHLTPGDHARSMLGDTASPAEIEALREELGLNDNLIVQYLRYMKNLVFMGVWELHMSAGVKLCQRF